MVGAALLNFDALVIGALRNCGSHGMARKVNVPSIKKAATILSILWPIACACMLLSMHYFTRSLIVFFSTLAAVPIVVSWVLVFVSQHLDKRTEPPWMRNRRKAGGRVKKKIRKGFA